MNRGIAKRTVFERERDMRKFLSLLARAVRAGSIELHAYCLMSTHFHLLVRSVNGSLGEVMQGVQNTYARWFNRTRMRDGPLFRGRFTSRRMKTATYRHAVVAYIDFNPVQARIVDRAEDYRYGSAHHYAVREGPRWLSRHWLERVVQEYTGASEYRPESYAGVYGGVQIEHARSMIARRLARSFSRTDPLDDLEHATPPAVLEWMRRKAMLADGTRTGWPVGDARALRATIRRGRAAGEWRLSARGQRIDAWDQVEAALLHDMCGLTMREISKATGRVESRVGRLCTRHREHMLRDDVYAERIVAIAEEVLSASNPERTAPPVSPGDGFAKPSEGGDREACVSRHESARPAGCVPGTV